MERGVIFRRLQRVNFARLLTLHFNGRMVIRFEGRDLAYREIPERPKRVPPALVVRPKPPKYIPPPTHPWRARFLRSQDAQPERP
jgi:hypothetical protein